MQKELFNDVMVTYEEQEASPAFYLDEVNGIKFTGILMNYKKLQQKTSMLFQNKSDGIEIVN